MVAESTEILAPMSQLGCATACSGVASRHVGQRPVAERPARRGQDQLLDRVALRSVEHLEDGVVLGVDRQQPRARRARRVGQQPAGADQASLLASATMAPRRAAARVGASPAAPTIAAITQSAGRRGGLDHRLGAGRDLDAGAGQRSLQRAIARGSATTASSRTRRRACSASSSTDVAGDQRLDRDSSRVARRSGRPCCGRPSRSSRGW